VGHDSYYIVPLRKGPIGGNDLNNFRFAADVGRSGIAHPRIWQGVMGVAKISATKWRHRPRLSSNSYFPRYRRTPLTWTIACPEPSWRRYKGILTGLFGIAAQSFHQKGVGQPLFSDIWAVPPTVGR